MKRALRAVIGCSIAIAALSGYLWQAVEAAREDIVLSMLSMPAPPPPNPAVQTTKSRPDSFFDKSKPPADNAPIGDLLDYWMSMSESFSVTQYSPQPSSAVVERLRKEIDKSPEKLPQLLNIFVNDDDGAAFVKGHYDSQGTTGIYDRETRRSIKDWLVYNSSYFSDELARKASEVTDTSDAYVSNQGELLALARHDFSKAKPILDRLYADGSRPVSQTLARWALYRNALKTNSIGDIEKYRDELKEIVENKRLGDGMRDLAMDALVVEKEWSGRDEWYYSLMTDETLVGMPRFTGMTTLINLSPAEKYRDRMIELLSHDSPTVRGAAVRNLSRKFDKDNPELIRALLPWLEDAKWAVDVDGTRGRVVEALTSLVMPEAVPGLIHLLTEKTTRAVPRFSGNAVSNSVSVPTIVSTTNSNTSRASGGQAEPVSYVEGDFYSSTAVRALAKQRDARAAAPLRRLLNETFGYERSAIVSALLASGGYSIPDQVAAFEFHVTSSEHERLSVAVNSAANLANTAANGEPINRPLSADELKRELGSAVALSEDVSDGFASALVDRIEYLDKAGPETAQVLRRAALRWENAVFVSLALRDVKNDRANLETVLNLLARRKELRERYSTEFAALSSGSDAAKGIMPCFFESEGEYDSVLDTATPRTKSAMLACARLIRAKLPIQKVASHLTATDKTLSTAAERYLESEDSPLSRSILLSRYPNQARIYGARAAFFIDGVTPHDSEQAYRLFSSVGESVYPGDDAPRDTELAKKEELLRAEVLKDDSLVGIYSYASNHIRIYRDRVGFSWDEDESRYRERLLQPQEFDELKSFLADSRVDELPPFLTCSNEDHHSECSTRELVMVGRAGGRRVYSSGGDSDFFRSLDRIFNEFQKQPAAVKYALSRELPGLEVIVADDNRFIETVWKSEGSLVAAVSRPAALTRRALTDASAPESEDESDEAAEGRSGILDYAWFRVAEGALSGEVSQPAGVELIVPKDTLEVPPSDYPWKAKAAGIEIRTSEQGLYRVAAGKLKVLAKGPHDSPVVSHDGRWAAASARDEDKFLIVRVDLTSGRVLQSPLPNYQKATPLAYVPTIRRFLVQVGYDYDDYHGEEYEDYVAPNVSAEAEASSLFLFDPVTGVLREAPGEFRPLAHATFRPLQPAGRPNEFWAAMLGENGSTDVGIYEIKTFGFRKFMTLPKIAFNSMKMFVDEPANRVYFVYRGHLLAIPLRKPTR